MLLHNYWVPLTLTSSHLGHASALHQEWRKGILPLITAHAGTSIHGAWKTECNVLRFVDPSLLSVFLYEEPPSPPPTHLPSSFLGKCMLNPLLLESLQNCLNDKEKKPSQYSLLWQNYWFKSHIIAQYYLKVNWRKMSLHPNRAKLICQESVMMCLFPHWGVYIFQEDTTVYLQVKSALKWEFQEIFPFQMVRLILWGPETHFCT